MSARLRDMQQRVLSEAQQVRTGRTPQRWVGLDIGARSLKLVELERTPEGVRLVKSLVQELPDAPPGQPVDRVGWLQIALNEFGVAEVHMSAGGEQVVLRRVAVPLMSKQELPEAVKWQVKDQLPFPLPEAVLDLRVTGEVWEKDIKKQDVLVAAAPRAVVGRCIEETERSGARVASLSPTQAALWRCVSALVPDVGQGSVAVVEIGAYATEITLVKDGQIRLVRELAMGSDTMTDALVGMVMSEHGQVVIDRSRADALKRRYGVLTDAADGTTEDGVPLFHLSSLMRPVLEHLLTELSRLFNFYKVQVDEAGVSRMFLCGGGANIKQLQAYLADGLGMTVEIFNPLVRITDQRQPLEPEQIAETGPRLGIAIGLALEHGQGLNLVPAEVRRSRSTVAARGRWMRAAAWAGSAAAALYAGLQLYALALGARIAHEQEAWARVAPAYQQSLRLAASANGLDSTVNQLERLLERQPVWDGFLKELGSLVPSTIELSEFAVAATGAPGQEALTFRLKGTGASTAVTGEGSVGQFMQTLEQSAFFSDVTLVSTAVDPADSSRITVEIQGRLE